MEKRLELACFSFVRTLSRPGWLKGGRRWRVGGGGCSTLTSCRVCYCRILRRYLCLPSTAGLSQVSSLRIHFLVSSSPFAFTFPIAMIYQRVNSTTTPNCNVLSMLCHLLSHFRILGWWRSFPPFNFTFTFSVATWSPCSSTTSYTCALPCCRGCGSPPPSPSPSCSSSSSTTLTLACARSI